jgi:hypothetical protein
MRRKRLRSRKTCCNVEVIEEMRNLQARLEAMEVAQ